ncbi:methyltransferase domain-containing protein [Granulicatella seriolae]|uniref:Methyltransferase domain-containing protein n=1 Tax=Granulicatella seriolae TaxID=2967226 RepID=A0ABT1WM31_9LACT|nr:methyltransferase domain-containing protein [Granulicatella seriolae]
MLKKIDASKLFLDEHLHLLQCPYCQSPFINMEGYSLVCAKGHHFDLSKKGTLHLMKQAANTDYNRDLFTHRYLLAQSGFFTPLLASLEPYFSHLASDGLIVDIGCGEGSQLAWLQEKFALSSTVGMDIAKEGIALASNHFANSAFWCLADLAQLPFANQSCSLLLNVLTPSHYQEFKRVLKEGGVFIKVVPGSNYLNELRQILYRSQPEKQTYNNQDIINRFFQECPGASQSSITYQVDLTPDIYGHLLHMTPLFWGASSEDKAYSLQNPLTSITVDYTILVYKHILD